MASISTLDLATSNVINDRDHPMHFVVVPLLAQGHMIPMADLAVLLASRGATVSLITTPVNARRLQSAADLAAGSGLSLRLIELPFPCSSATGLPEGCENIDLITDNNHLLPFFECLSLLADPLISYIRSNPPCPTCIISDNCMPWTMQVAGELKIPRFVFHGPSCFFLLCTLKLEQHDLYNRVTDDSEVFEVPDMPEKIEVTKRTATRFFDWSITKELFKLVQKSDRAADGFVINTFEELEPWYIREYRRAIGKEVWAVGPVSAFHKESAGKAARGNRTAAVEQERILRWLDGRENGSVLYVSFGTVARTRLDQVVEIGLGLEAAGRPFIWAVKMEEQNSGEVEKWAAELEERNEGKGIIIRGWVPQVLILTHAAVGAFMTHCGWNSTLEGISAGVVMVTCPHFADQFMNEKVVVEIVGTGVEMGGTWPTITGIEKTVGREEVEKAVRSVMAGDERMRKRAAEIGKKAMRAMEEGGSSYLNLSMMIDYASKLGGHAV